MLVVEEDGYSFLLTGVSEQDIKFFTHYLQSQNPACDGVVGISHFKIPKNDVKSDVFVVDCLNSRYALRLSVDYWIDKGQRCEKENLELLQS